VPSDSKLKLRFSIQNTLSIMVYLLSNLYTHSKLKLGKIIIAFTVAAMIISSPIFIFTGPIQVSAATIPAAAGNPNGIDTSAYHSNMPTTSSTTPTSTMSQDGDFTTQAALSLTRAAQTNNFVASKAFYDISFRTTTAGVIKSVVMDFPAGTSVGSALIVEAVGIGPGTLSASAGEVLTYTVTNAVNVPANTIIRIQISNINNPATPNAAYTLTIQTRNPANAIIDGPTTTSAYNMVQVGNAQIAPGAVTTTKIATGAVTTGDIADGAITGSKMAGITKLIFGTCTGSLPSLAPTGGLGEFSCLESNSEMADEIVAHWSSGRELPAPVLINSVAFDGSVAFGFENPGSVATAAQPTIDISYIVFKKP
jgi:hypothetical protein